LKDQTNSFHIWKLSSSPRDYFRYVKLVQTGENWKGNLFFVLHSLEIYGNMLLDKLEQVQTIPEVSESKDDTNIAALSTSKLIHVSIQDVLVKHPVELIDSDSLGKRLRAYYCGICITVRQISFCKIPAHEQSRFEHAVAYASSLSHPNLLGILGLARNEAEGNWLLLEEGESYRSLSDVLGDESVRNDLSEEVRLRMCLDLLKAVSYLHEQAGKPHGALFPGSILCSGSYRLVLSDYIWPECLSVLDSAGVGLSSSYVWLSPEVLLGKSASLSSDVYSCGMLVPNALTCHQQWAPS
jgi:serine/threonine protein kinase